MTVVDASVLIDAFAGRRAAVTALEDAGALVAPPVMRLEVLNRVRRWRQGGTMPAEVADRAAQGVLALPVEDRHEPELLPRVWELCTNLTPIDASYAALAEHLGAPLLTADARIARTPGLRCEVHVVGDR